MNQLFYKIFFIVLIMSLVSAKVEFSFAVSILAIVVSFQSKINKRLTTPSFLLLMILAVGLPGLLYSDVTFGNYFKDVVYFIRPPLVIYASYLLISKIDNKNFLFTAIIGLSFLYAIHHIGRILMYMSEADSISDLRSIGGRYNHLELIGMVFITLVKDLQIKRKLGSLLYKTLVCILVISFIIYFSRVMFVVYIAFILAYKGYLKVSAKGIKAAFFILVGLFALMYVVNKFDVDSNSKGVGGFVFKIQNTYNEMFESLDIETIKRDKRDLWKHWRGYEAQNAIQQLDEKGGMSVIFGRGLGASVDLGIEVYLSGEAFEEITILHNGYIYVLFKTGIIGLVFYLIYILIFYLYYQIKASSRTTFALNRLLVGCAFYIAVSSLVVSGIYKPYDFSSLLIGGIFALKSFYNEDRNIGN